MDNLAIVPLVALLGGVLLQLILGRVLTRPAKGWLALASGLAALAAALAMLPSVAGGTTLQVDVFSWDVGIPLRYHVDGLSMVFMLMATGIGSAILLYCVRYMAHEPDGTTRFYALMLTFIAGLVNLVSSGHLLMTYVSWEVVGLCSYFLVGFWYKERAAADGARKVLVMTHIPGYGLLAAILLLYARSGTFLWTDPALQAAFTGGIFALMLVAAMAKSVMFPLHTWIPEAMNAPTPVSALLHSACYVKAGVYLIARMYAMVPHAAPSAASPWPAAWNTAVLVLGCLTMLVGALFALAQTDLKRLLAYSTISQLGHIITALGLGTTLGVAAGLFYCLSHGLFKATLFLCAGAVQHATGTRDMRRLGGLAGPMPHTAAIWLIAAAAIVGVPLSNGFIAKWLLYSSALDAGQTLVVVVAWIASIFTAFYMLKATASVFFGEMPVSLRQARVEEAPLGMRWGMGILAAGCLVFGVAPQLLMSGVVIPAVRSLGFDWAPAASFLGVGGSQATIGAVAVLLAAAAGWGIYRLSRPPRGQPVGIFTGGDPLPAEGSTVTAADFAEIAVAGFAPVYAATDPDPIYAAAWRGLSRAAVRLDAALDPLAERRPLLAAAAVAVVVLAAAWIAW